MAKYLLSQFLQAVLVIVFVTLVVAVMLRFSGDPAVALFQGASAPSEEELQEIRQALGLNQPFLTQYGNFLSGLLTGNLGISFRSKTAVSTLVWQAMPPTLLLALTSLLISILISLPLGIYAAVHKGRWADQFIRMFSLLGLSFPNFWLGIMLVLIFGVVLGWLPPSGYESALSLILPSVTLGLILTSTTVRLLRASLLEVLGSQYVTVARSKGLSERRVLYKHALRNTAIPVITFIGLQFGGLIGGVVVVEQVFAWPGLGSLALQAIANRDYPVLQGTVTVLAVMVVLVNFLVDLSYGWFDPRIRME
ncbi:nickel ABC transporter permease [Deinococcus peraridilitoris]|uniref:ABC-type dipeptide/oligopeptide/nickel transport system, permease component n=1 Tax=Deinococcus peraridilitoris (strain DSM 19664 / LMG 22246 / CIP 109416 / KR-200) TaxID=937777 RepID=L0A691_DEIPD|nr:nickel ABC transporter permease [Deinococcus peraridilitoris]AFZ69366.1 ABC-type dipeptide/oligopeptide/nickel transport system, permease component [Deinococcus peraridilitoris DSM 19664]